MSKVVSLDPMGIEAARDKVEYLIEKQCPCILVIGIGRNADGMSFMNAMSYGDVLSPDSINGMALAGAVLQRDAVELFMDVAAAARGEVDEP